MASCPAYSAAAALGKPGWWDGIRRASAGVAGDMQSIVVADPGATSRGLRGAAIWGLSEDNRAVGLARGPFIEPAVDAGAGGQTQGECLGPGAGGGGFGLGLAYLSAGREQGD